MRCRRMRGTEVGGPEVGLRLLLTQILVRKAEAGSPSAFAHYLGCGNSRQGLRLQHRSRGRTEKTAIQKANGHPSGMPVEVSAKIRDAALCPGADGSRFARGDGLLFAVHFARLLRLSTLADVNAALEERAVFDGDAGRDHVAGQ